MEASVNENGQHDQHVGEDDDEADQHAEADDDIVTLAPAVADVLAAGFVEELDIAVVVTTAYVLFYRVHQHDLMGVGCGGKGG